MGIFKDMLYTGVRKREAQEEYERTHPRTPRASYQDDYSSSSSRPKRIRYRAYCRNCGITASFAQSTPGETIRTLQFDSRGCGQNNHFPQIQEIEE